MVISKTPWRISFFGGGTDLPAWYRENGGAVLSTTIDKYGYITARYLPPFFEHKNLVVWSHIEKTRNIHEILHPSVRETLKHLNIHDGVGIHFDGDLPARTGLGSSSAFTVGLLNALYALRNEPVTKRKLAEEAVHIEQNLIKETVGTQDQVAAAYGGLNKIAFGGAEEFIVTPIALPKERLDELERHLLLVFTGFSRSASEIEASKVVNFSKKAQDLKAMHNMVDDACVILTDSSRDIQEFGRLLDESWQLKRSLSEKVSTEPIDGMYAEAQAAGAIGGKLLGAGGGGFMLLFAPPEMHDAIQLRLRGLLHVPFAFDSLGSHIIHKTGESTAAV